MLAGSAGPPHTMITSRLSHGKRSVLSWTLCTKTWAERDLLDICTGTGHLAGAAGARGARVVGVDFADSMVVAARKNYPDVRFRQGDA